MIRTLKKLVKGLRLLSHRRWLYGLTRGVAAAIEHRQLPIPPDIKTVIDVGANRGQFALYMRVQAPDAHIHCFEPLASPRSTLSGLFAHDPNVHIYPVAAAATASEGLMHVSRKDDSSSLLAITRRQTRYFPGTEEVRTETVRTVRLDDVMRPKELVEPILLKIDVQGYELQCLRGAVDLIRRTAIVVVECSFVEFYANQALFDDIYEWLRNQGVHMAAAHCTARTPSGSWLQADVAFIPSS